MALLVALCALIGALFLLPFLPTLLFVLVFAYGLLKVIEAWAKPPPPKPPRRRTDASND